GQTDSIERCRREARGAQDAAIVRGRSRFDSAAGSTRGPPQDPTGAAQHPKIGLARHYCRTLEVSRPRSIHAGGLDVHAAPFLIEVNLSFDERKDRVVASQADVPPGAPLGAALPDDDVSGNDRFAAELLNPQPLGARIAAVP